MKKFLFLFVWITVRFAANANSPLHFINAGSASIFQPIFAADDTTLSQKIYLLNQEIKVDVFQRYIVVRADYWFNNSSDATISLFVGFPSCKNPGDETCSNLYWLRVL